MNKILNMINFNEKFLIIKKLALPLLLIIACATSVDTHCQENKETNYARVIWGYFCAYFGFSGLCGFAPATILCSGDIVSSFITNHSILSSNESDLSFIKNAQKTPGF